MRYADSGWSSNDLKTKRSMSRCVMRYAGGALSQAVQAPTECGAGYRRTLCCLMRQEKNMAPFTRRQAQLISQVHGEETPITGIRRLESVRD